MKRLSFVTALFLVLFICFSCNNKGIFQSGLNEGIIEYAIEYPGLDRDNIYLGILPDKMNFRFKENKFVSEMKSGMGAIAFSFIFDGNKCSLVQLLKVVNSQYKILLDSAEVSNHISGKANKLHVEFSKETKIIAGYKCKKATIQESSETPPFDVYYTNEINIKNANFPTPFPMIDGVLMEYRMKKFNFDMQVTAKKVLESDIANSEFNTPENYKRINLDQLNEILNSF